MAVYIMALSSVYLLAIFSLSLPWILLFSWTVEALNKRGDNWELCRLTAYVRACGRKGILENAILH